MIGSILWFAFIAIVVLRIVNRSKATQKTQKQHMWQTDASGSYQSSEQSPVSQQQNTVSQRSSMYRTPQQGSETKQRVVTDADRARLEAYRQKKAQSGAYVPSKPVQPNQELDANRKRHASQPSIVERAKANSQKYANRDETLEELESQHRHSERVGSAVAGYVEQERTEHRRMHEGPMRGVEESGLLGSVEDLMVKGFDGNLSFERDFIGEAEDMLATFTMSR